jgi:flagellar M-ring protein FliF
VHAEVSAELDFDQVTLTEETYDPEGQVVRSAQTVEEETQNSERDDNDAVTVGNNLPNAAAETPAAGRSANENTTRTEETINSEISRRVRNQTQVGGRVRRLSVAVLVDGRMVPDEQGEVYQPRATDELAQIESLVRSAIGFDAARGDVVEVRNLQFTVPPLDLDESSWFELNRQDLMRLAELAALALVALMLIFLVVRPLLRRLLPPPGAAPAALDGPGNQALPAGGARALTDGGRPPALAAPGEGGDDDGVALDPATRKRGELIKRARSVIEQSPDEAAAVLRTWLQES